MAPEIIKKVPYHGDKADLFACGVILFIMVTGVMPFDMARTTDRFYKNLIENNHGLFWEQHVKSGPDTSYSLEFK